MIDAHVHIERGTYNLEWIKRFTDRAVEMGVDCLQLLEHSHRFREFEGLYRDIAAYNAFQRDWLKEKMMLGLDQYKSLIEQARAVRWPVELRFGLEICYVEGCEDIIASAVKDFDWDFLTGSVHWIDDWGFDHKPEFWEGMDVDEVYDRYYKSMFSLIKSGLFSILAHPDSIKCFGHCPGNDLKDTYYRLAVLLRHSGVKAEQSAGLYINYGYPEAGMNPVMLDIFKKHCVEIVTASDAHRPEDVGAMAAEMDRMLRT
jgi:histidinol-phosphatase (PHP family)